MHLLFHSNRFRFTVHQFSNRSQMMSKCGMKKSGTHGKAKCVTDVVFSTKGLGI